MSGLNWYSFVNDTGVKTQIINATEVNSNFDWLEGDILPQLAGVTTTATYDLGSPSAHWAEGYVDALPSVTSARITNLTVTTANITNLTATSANIGTASITTANIAGGYAVVNTLQATVITTTNAYISGGLISISKSTDDSYIALKLTNNHATPLYTRLQFINEDTDAEIRTERTSQIANGARMSFWVDEPAAGTLTERLKILENGTLTSMTDVDTPAASITSLWANNLMVAGPINYSGASRVRIYSADSTQAITNTTWTKVSLNTEDYDNLGEFDPVTNYRFTALRTGYYQINAQVNYTAYIDQKIYRIAIYKNGANITEGVIHGSGTDALPIGIMVSDVVYLTATSYIELYSWHNGGSDKNIYGGSPYTFMSIHRLS